MIYRRKTKTCISRSDETALSDYFNINPMNKVSTKNINQVQSMSSEKPKRILPEADSALSPPHPTLPFPVPYI